MPDTPPEIRDVLERARQDMPELAGVTPSAGLAQAAIDAGIAPDPRASNGEAPNSLIAGLREQHHRIGLAKTTTIALPWWEGKLGVRFHYLDDRGFDRLLEIAAGSGTPDEIKRANRDLVIAGCDEVVARADTGDDWGPLMEGEHLRFDRRLADLLQLGGVRDSARSVLEGLWDDPVKAQLAIGQLAGDYSTWLRGQAPGVADRLVGESRRPDR
jgi:hypothetical protein